MPLEASSEDSITVTWSRRSDGASPHWEARKFLRPEHESSAASVARLIATRQGTWSRPPGHVLNQSMIVNLLARQCEIGRVLPFFQLVMEVD